MWGLEDPEGWNVHSAGSTWDRAGGREGPGAELTFSCHM